MSLPTGPDDIPHLRGDAAGVRAAAASIRSTIAQLDVVEVAARRVHAVCDGTHWSGRAFEAFRRALEPEPVPAAIVRARERMEEAASRLEWFATRFEDNSRTIAWCRHRLWSLGLDGTGVPDELVAEVGRIAAEAERARDDHRAALRTLADVFDWLDDQPTFATPPPSNLDRATGAVHGVGRFVRDVHVGGAEALWELGTFAAGLALAGQPGAAPWAAPRVWDAGRRFEDLLRYALDHPDEFTIEFGKAAVDTETWTEDGVAHWIGRRLPDLTLTVVTGGLGKVGTTGASATRVARQVRRVNSVADAEEISGKLHAVSASRSR